MKKKHKSSITKYIFIGAVLAVLIIAALLLKTKEQPETDTIKKPIPAAEKKVTKRKPVSERDTDIPQHSHKIPSQKQDTKQKDFSNEEINTTENIEPTPEQEFHYQKTQMFIAEAKDKLPLVGIRAFNALQATVREGDEPSDSGRNIPGRDKKGMRDGEIWIRINGAYSKEQNEIMAQAADLYRSNVDFDGEITVLLWVGGQPIARETYSAW